MAPPEVAVSTPPKCGIVMPLSPIDGCTEHHWNDVRAIIVDAAQQAGLQPELVSESHETGVIHKRIVENLYTNPLVVCDTSARNPNVMFELGLRLAFDKPTLIIKDDVTPVSFDTGLIEYIQYRRDLRYSDTICFRDKLAERMRQMIQKSTAGAYSPFLQAVGSLRAVQLPTEEIPYAQLVASEIQQLRRSMNELFATLSRPDMPPGLPPLRSESHYIGERLSRHLRGQMSPTMRNQAVDQLIKAGTESVAGGKMKSGSDEHRKALRVALKQHFESINVPQPDSWQGDILIDAALDLMACGETRCQS